MSWHGMSWHVMWCDGGNQWSTGASHQTINQWTSSDYIIRLHHQTMSNTITNHHDYREARGTWALLRTWTRPSVTLQPSWACCRKSPWRYVLKRNVMYSRVLCNCVKTVCNDPIATAIIPLLTLHYDIIHSFIQSIQSNLLDLQLGNHGRCSSNHVSSKHQGHQWYWCCLGRTVGWWRQGQACRSS